MNRTRQLWPWTLRGMMTLAFSGTALFFIGVPRADVLATVLSMTVLVVVAALTLVTMAAGSYATWRLHRITAGACSVETEAPTEPPFAVPRLAWLPFHDLVVAGPQHGLIFALAGNRMTMRATRRGEWDDLRLSWRVSDAFGLTSVAGTFLSRAPLTVSPHRGKLHRGMASLGLVPGEDQHHPRGAWEGDRVDIRAHQPTDPARFVHWKRFARTGKLATRQRERAIVWQKRVAMFLWAESGAASEPHWDEASAALARVFVEEAESSEDWVFASAPNGAPCTGLRAAQSAIRKSTSGNSAAALRSFLDALGPEPATLLLFVPERTVHLGECESLLRAWTQKGGAVQAYMGLDAAVPRAEVFDVLKRLRVPLTIVQRLDGHVVSHAQDREADDRAWRHAG